MNDVQSMLTGRVDSSQIQSALENTASQTDISQIKKMMKKLLEEVDEKAAYRDLRSVLT